MKKLLKNLVKFAAYGSLAFVGLLVLSFFIVDPAEAEEAQPPAAVQQSTEQVAKQVEADTPDKKQVSVTIATDPAGLTVELRRGKDFKKRTVETAPFEVKLEAGEKVVYNVEEGDATEAMVGNITAPEIDGQTVSIWANRKPIAEVNAPKLEEVKYAVATTCEKIVKSKLLAPSTAKFADYWNVDDAYRANPEEGVALYKSTVDAQNGFGAMIRNDFACKYTLETNMTELVYLN